MQGEHTRQTSNFVNQESTLERHRCIGEREDTACILLRQNVGQWSYMVTVTVRVCVSIMIKYDFFLCKTLDVLNGWWWRSAKRKKCMQPVNICANIKSEEGKTMEVNLLINKLQWAYARPKLWPWHMHMYNYIIRMKLAILFVMFTSKPQNFWYV